MGIFPGFGVWINQYNQKPPKAESKRSESVKSKSVSETNTHEEREETKKQLKLWRDQEKKCPWHDYPPKVKVKQTKEGDSQMNMQFTIGLPPETVFDILTSHDNQTYSYFSILKRRKILVNISRKVLSDNGPQEKLVEVEKSAAWKFLWWSGAIPIHLTFNENRKDFTALYTISRENVMYMKMFAGKVKVEPWYINNDRMLPKSREEYKKCTGGQGLVGSRVILDQVFEPVFPLNLPPVDWYIRGVTIKNTKAIMENLQIRGAVLRSV